MRGSKLTLGALLVGDDVDDLEALLEQDAIGDLVLDGELDSYAAGVGLGPEEGGGDEADGGEGFGDLFEADGYMRRER